MAIRTKAEAGKRGARAGRVAAAVAFVLVATGASAAQAITDGTSNTVATAEQYSSNVAGVLPTADSAEPASGLPTGKRMHKPFTYIAGD